MFTREELYQRMRYSELTRLFRSYWQYQNLMFMTAGYLRGSRNGTTGAGGEGPDLHAAW
ncbi:MAG: hypothetical protein IPJ56_18200 [Gemmatimonadetes bacterium]|nr:hypothetical protein [Gemmatimonadota bacterium]